MVFYFPKESGTEFIKKEEFLPNPAKAGDGKLKGLTITLVVGSQLPGQRTYARQKRDIPQEIGKHEKI